VLWFRAVSRRPLSAEALVRSQVSPCEICGGERDTGTGFSPNTLSEFGGSLNRKILSLFILSLIGYTSHNDVFSLALYIAGDVT